jgi:hypothetical protein
MGTDRIWDFNLSSVAIRVIRGPSFYHDRSVAPLIRVERLQKALENLGATKRWASPSGYDRLKDSHWNREAI